MYIIPGDPCPWARAAPARHGGMYDTQKKIKFSWGILLRNQHALIARTRSTPLYQGALAMQITWYMPMPQSWSTAKKKRMLGKPISVKPDLDNLEKLLLDTCKGILYKDDAQVARVCKQKIYSDNPRTEFMVDEI